MEDGTHEFKYESASCDVVIRKGVAKVLYVYSKHRGRGHAKGLLRRVTEWADENGLELTLTAQGYGGPVQTMLDQNQLIKFYESFGFERADDEGRMTHVEMIRRVA